MMVFYWTVLEKVQVVSYRDTVEGHCAQQPCSPPGPASPVSNSCALQEVSEAVIITERSPVESEGHFFVAISSKVCA